ncbi:MAG TPA: hypothetical protein VMU45_08385 [Candidatus Eisenbacteria bacterium]|nr:hypothetical protein [Candidatus Eisenbacteria bacterium]
MARDATADLGDPHAALNLAIVLSDSQAPDADWVAAVTWFEIARQRGMQPGPAPETLLVRLTPMQAKSASLSASSWLALH